jgi:hypothetical protein
MTVLPRKGSSHEKLETKKIGKREKLQLQLAGVDYDKSLVVSSNGTKKNI